MLAKRIMVTHLITAQVDECISDVLKRMRDSDLRMLPVLYPDQTVAGIFSTFSLLSHIVPDYIVSGDLDQVSYAPDMGILHQHYIELSTKEVAVALDKVPVTVHPHDSLLSVAASLASFCKHEYVLVVDDQEKLLGIISAGDILDFLQLAKQGDGNDA
ncbi:MAG: CBS domain-containing protein [Mariprofundaceae bacterium]|nr:CBS domain-containing protein [Mariprofundaceae bacterium]